uniref:Uncharacterized protein n=1 Tax=Schistosoma mansoni TaxID=6183 RepID=A0A5K4F5D2_SCHMA
MAAVQGGDDVLTPSKKSTEACRKDLESINNQLEASIRDIEKSLVSMEERFSSSNC